MERLHTVYVAMVPLTFRRSDSELSAVSTILNLCRYIVKKVS